VPVLTRDLSFGPRDLPISQVHVPMTRAFFREYVSDHEERGVPKKGLASLQRLLSVMNPNKFHALECVLLFVVTNAPRHARVVWLLLTALSPTFISRVDSCPALSVVGLMNSMCVCVCGGGGGPY
jgi:hypothetical protein